MADDENKEGQDKERGETRDFEVEGSVEGEASVTELSSKKQEEKPMTTLIVGDQHMALDPDDPDVQRLVSKGAGGERAKAAAGSAAPRAVTRSGRVD